MHMHMFFLETFQTKRSTCCDSAKLPPWLPLDALAQIAKEVAPEVVKQQAAVVGAKPDSPSHVDELKYSCSDRY